MKQVAYWTWRKLNLQGTKLENTGYKMDAETALARHPEAVRVLGTMELRNVAEEGDDPSLSLNTRPKIKRD